MMRMRPVAERMRGMSHGRSLNFQRDRQARPTKVATLMKMKPATLPPKARRIPARMGFAS